MAAWLYEIITLPSDDIALKRIGEHEEPLFTLRIARDAQGALGGSKEALAKIMFESALEYLNGMDKDFYHESAANEEDITNPEYEEMMPAIH